MCQMSERCVEEDYQRMLYNQKIEAEEKEIRESKEKAEAARKREQYLCLLEKAKKSINW